jgi:hypothetical protein
MIIHLKIHVICYSDVRRQTSQTRQRYTYVQDTGTKDFIFSRNNTFKPTHGTVQRHKKVVRLHTH